MTESEDLRKTFASLLTHDGALSATRPIIELVLDGIEDDSHSRIDEETLTTRILAALVLLETRIELLESSVSNKPA